LWISTSTCYVYNTRRQIRTLWYLAYPSSAQVIDILGDNFWNHGRDGRPNETSRSNGSGLMAAPALQHSDIALAASPRNGVSVHVKATVSRMPSSPLIRNPHTSDVSTAALVDTDHRRHERTPKRMDGGGSLKRTCNVKGTSWNAILEFFVVLAVHLVTSYPVSREFSELRASHHFDVAWCKIPTVSLVQNGSQFTGTMRTHLKGPSGMSLELFTRYCPHDSHQFADLNVSIRLG
jgi:hypothetical protein